VTSPSPPDATRAVIEHMTRRGLTMAVAESLTGGLLVAELIRIPGASRVIRGGVVAYATDLKHALLGVDEGILSTRGPVDPDVAVQMAEGVRRRLGHGVDAASWGLSTTGVAGPGPQDGQAAGTVFVGLATEGRSFARKLQLHGDRDDVRRQTVATAIRLLLEAIEAEPADEE
jgi:nicotinamide-nucleotide amidase